jgi:hypothetical protein
MDKFRQFLESSSGKYTAIALGGASVLCLIFMVRAYWFDDGGASLINNPMWIDPKTGKAFRAPIVAGQVSPGVPAVGCWWTADGQIASEPHWVLMNEYINKPGPTFCPECKRQVDALKGKPEPGTKPPPTEAESKRR